MKNFLAFAYIFLVLLGVFLIFLAAMKAKKKEIVKAKKMFFSALISIALAMILIVVTGIVVTN